MFLLHICFFKCALNLNPVKTEQTNQNIHNKTKQKKVLSFKQLWIAQRPRLESNKTDKMSMKLFLMVFGFTYTVSP